MGCKYFSGTMDRRNGVSALRDRFFTDAAAGNAISQYDNVEDRHVWDECKKLGLHRRVVG